MRRSEGEKKEQETAITQTRRWQYYLLREGDEFHNFWEEYLKTERNILYVIGWGFDPRMCIGLEAILKAGGKGRRDCWLIDFDEGDSSPSRKHDSTRQQNLLRFNSLVNGKMNKIDKKIMMVDENNHRVDSRRAAQLFSKLNELQQYSDIIVDISALPLSIYFPILGKLLYLIDKAGKGEKTPNLHVVLAENAYLDSKIKDQEVEEDARYLFGFASDLTVESTAIARDSATKIPKLWIPILGEDKHTQLDRIALLVKPDEICPVLPSPSIDPRRPDNLILEYRELFTKMRVELKNIVFGSEQNPFEVYREIFETVERYGRALQSLGGCKIAISPLSSKLLSISAFLVAYEARVKNISAGIAYVSAKGYIMEDSVDIPAVNSNSRLFTLWISGDCYAK